MHALSKSTLLFRNLLKAKDVKILIAPPNCAVLFIKKLSKF